MNESIQVIVTKCKNRAKQNIPNYTGLVIASVLVISHVNTSYLNTSLNYR